MFSLNHGVIFDQLEADVGAAWVAAEQEVGNECAGFGWVDPNRAIFGKSERIRVIREDVEVLDAWFLENRVVDDQGGLGLLPQM